MFESISNIVDPQQKKSLINLARTRLTDKHRGDHQQYVQDLENNYDILNRYVEAYGWPTTAKLETLGITPEDALALETSAFLSIQHLDANIVPRLFATNPKIDVNKLSATEWQSRLAIDDIPRRQAEMLNIMRRDNAHPAMICYLTDRFLRDQNLPQEFGTQIYPIQAANQAINIAEQTYSLAEVAADVFLQNQLITKRNSKGFEEQHIFAIGQTKQPLQFLDQGMLIAFNAFAEINTKVDQDIHLVKAAIIAHGDKCYSYGRMTDNLPQDNSQISEVKDFIFKLLNLSQDTDINLVSQALASGGDNEYKQKLTQAVAKIKNNEEAYNRQTEHKCNLYTKIADDLNNGLVVKLLQKTINLTVKEQSMTSLPQSCCHGDLTAANIMVNRNGGMTLIDFDELYYGPRVKDLVELMSNNFAIYPKENFRTEPNLSSMKQTIKAFDQEVGLTGAEFESLVSLLESRLLIYSTRRLSNININEMAQNDLEIGRLNEIISKAQPYESITLMNRQLEQLDSVTSMVKEVMSEKIAEISKGNVGQIIDTAKASASAKLSVQEVTEQDSLPKAPAVSKVQVQPPAPGYSK